MPQRTNHNYKFPSEITSSRDADNEKVFRASCDRTIECPAKASNCPTNVSLNNISPSILLTDGFSAHKIDLCDKSSHLCPA